VAADNLAYADAHAQAVAAVNCPGQVPNDKTCWPVTCTGGKTICASQGAPAEGCVEAGEIHAVDVGTANDQALALAKVRAQVIADQYCLFWNKGVIGHSKCPDGTTYDLPYPDCQYSSPDSQQAADDLAQPYADQQATLKQVCSTKLNGLAWVVPCDNDDRYYCRDFTDADGTHHGKPVCNCDGAGQGTVPGKLGGDINTLYVATFRVRGCVELGRYFLGVNGGEPPTIAGTQDFLVKNVIPYHTADPFTAANEYWLEIHDPKTGVVDKYYLNNNHLAQWPENTTYQLEYTFDVTMHGTSDVLLKWDTRLEGLGENAHYRELNSWYQNQTANVYPDYPLDPRITQPFCGQWIQLDVMGDPRPAP
jgi:hypothetical protein